MSDTHSSSRLCTARGPWWWQWELATLTLLVVGLYFTRLADVPVCGEESRWASAAREMILTGDWIVPRQQGEVFPERPPLGSWAMAIVGLARGDLDLVAVRLPSSIAILLLTWLIYGYTRAWASRQAAFASAAIFATIGQVLILGRLGESEAVFTLFTAAGLLVWHWGYLGRWHPAVMWLAGYGLIGLGALAKGLQPPVYFVAVTGVYLAVRRDWRTLLGRWHAVGLAALVVIVGLWLVPFARDQWYAVDDIWAGLAQDRFMLQGLPAHLARFPLETLACLLPWSPLLFVFAAPSARRWLIHERPEALFLVVAVAVTYPTVWAAALARGRYYMPLYPCLAVLMGLAAEHCSTHAASRWCRAFWRHYVRTLAVVIAVGGVGLVVIARVQFERLPNASQPASFLVFWAVSAAAATVILARSASGTRWPGPQVASATVAAFIGLAYVGAVLNTRVQGGNDLSPAIAQIKSRIESGELVSLGRVYHRFAFSYPTPIRQVPWPAKADDLPPGVTWFCYDWHPHYDTEQLRNGGDSRQAVTTSGRLPFAWEKVAEIPCDPVKRDKAHRSVVIGRVRRDVQVAGPTVNRPARR